MKLYSENQNYKLYHGNMLDMLDVIEPNTIDSIVTDPPYELNFMSKGWDNAGVSFQKETWRKCYEVLKPGGYLLAFGGSRTFHRIACAIEDAGFEIRDTIMWLYGSGFPKSMDISKQIDKKPQANRTIEFKKWLKEKLDNCGKTYKQINDECGFTATSYSKTDFKDNWSINYPSKEKWLKMKEIIGITEIDYDWVCENNIEKRGFIEPTGGLAGGSGNTVGCFTGKQLSDNAIDSKAKQWQGWGTALKPSYESIIIAQKPYSIEIYLLIGILDILNEVIEKCQLKLNANIVEKISKLNQAKQSVEENIVLKNAESKMFTKEDLLEVMDMLQSTLMENMNLNTELLCLNFLVEICNQMNKYTTETKINLITELKILKLLVVENILKNTTQENKMKQLGMKQNALTVEEFLKEEKLKLNYMNILSVQDNVILKEEKSNLHPSLNQIIVARKPFKGSLVDNIIENGVGGINIDECRVGDEELHNSYMGKRSEVFSQNRTDTEAGMFTGDKKGETVVNGRFPANTILTYDETDFDEVCGGFPNTKSTGGKRNDEKTTSNMNVPFANHKSGEHYLDSGSASRYFYCAKASKRDRDEGLEEFETKSHEEINNRKEGSAGATRQYGGGTNPFLSVSCPRKNTHPTVKPTSLMQYLVRLVTPNGGIVLDPFNGSGSTGKAVMYENHDRNKDYKYIGIELTEEYLPIAKARIEYVCNLKEEKQTTIDDFIGESNE